MVLLDREVQPVGSGCTSTYLVRPDTPCLSPDPSNSANSPQDTSRAPQDTPSGTELARETMVRNVMQTSQWGAMEPTQETGPAPSAAGADLAPKPRSATTPCLATEEPELLLRSYDIKVQNTILNSRAPSTRNIYAYRWKLFSDWYTPRKLDPEHCPVQMMTVSCDDFVVIRLNLCMSKRNSIQWEALPLLVLTILLSLLL